MLRGSFPTPQVITQEGTLRVTLALPLLSEIEPAGDRGEEVF